jgi:hypothetical protein
VRGATFLLRIADSLPKHHRTLTFNKTVILFLPTWRPKEQAGSAIDLLGHHKPDTFAPDVPVAFIHQRIEVALNLAVRLYFALLLEVAVVVGVFGDSIVNKHIVVACMFAKHITSEYTSLGKPAWYNTVASAALFG